MASVRLDQDLEQRLEWVAQRQGRTVPSILREALDQYCDAELEGQTLDITLADVAGCLDSGGRSDATKIKDVFEEVRGGKRPPGRARPVAAARGARDMAKWPRTARLRT